jgi:hypothetical protein
MTGNCVQCGAPLADATDVIRVSAAGVGLAFDSWLCVAQFAAVAAVESDEPMPTLDMAGSR